MAAVDSASEVVECRKGRQKVHMPAQPGQIMYYNIIQSRLYFEVV